MAQQPQTSADFSHAHSGLASGTNSFRFRQRLRKAVVNAAASYQYIAGVPRSGALKRSLERQPFLHIEEERESSMPVGFEPEDALPKSISLPGWYESKAEMNVEVVSGEAEAEILEMDAGEAREKDIASEDRECEQEEVLDEFIELEGAFDNVYEEEHAAGTEEDALVNEAMDLSPDDELTDDEDWEDDEEFEDEEDWEDEDDLEDDEEEDEDEIEQLEFAAEQQEAARQDSDDAIDLDYSWDSEDEVIEHQELARETAWNKADTVASLWTKNCFLVNQNPIDLPRCAHNDEKKISIRQTGAKC